jgi:cytochrome c oxidase assembly protein subunit 15
LNIWLLLLITLQLIYAAFMAGLHAAFAAVTWPDMNGQWIPAGMLTLGGFWEDITHNLITVHFIHRALAYIICIPVIIWTIKSKDLPANSLLRKIRFVPLLLLLVQILLGVLTVINSSGQIPLIYAIMHQFVGMLFLLAFVATLFLSGGRLGK